MNLGRPAAVLLVLSWAPLFAPAACSSDEAGAQGKPADAGGDATFAESACGKCVAQACASEALACAGDAQCAAWLTCLQSCPAASGAVEPACASNCVPPPSGPGGDAQKAFASCMDLGAGAACATCGPDGGAPGKGSDADADAPSCPASSQSDPCSRCNEERCCEATAACSKNPECVSLAACYGTCGGDSACQLKCANDHPSGVAEWGHSQACQVVSCSGSDDCNGPVCTQCVAQKCGNVFDACWSDADCYRFAKCFLTCSDSQCVKACQDATPNGVSKFDAFVQCQLDQCGNQC